MAYLGAHVSISGGVHHAPERGRRIRADAIQIFTANQHRWQGKEISAFDAQAFKEQIVAQSMKACISHAAYLINLGASDDVVHEKSWEAMLRELQRCDLLDVPAVVIHPGAHRGQGMAAACRKISESLDHCFAHESSGQVMVLLETTAGQGTVVGSRFTELAEIISQSSYQDRLGVCIDTAHLFAAGYDIRTKAKFKRVMNEFDEELGLPRLKAVHMNDTERLLGSKVDRHQSIGQGQLGLEPFVFIAGDDRFKNIPCILETPVTSFNEYARELEMIRRAAGLK